MESHAPSFLRYEVDVFAFSNVTNDTDLGLDIFGTGCLSRSNSLTRCVETDPCYLYLGLQKNQTKPN